MLVKVNLFIIILAGLMNGSFVIPSKFIKNTHHEIIWSYHSVIALIIMPWLILGLISPYAIHNYLLLPPYILSDIVLSGIVFGLGQVCFSYAIETIGIALSFAINLGIGVTIGSMFIVFYKGDFFTIQNFFVTSSVFLIICSLITHYFATKNNQGCADRFSYRMGWLLAAIAGFTSGLQNVTFVMVAFHIKTLFQINNSFWVWPPFLSSAALPMLLGFIYKIKSNPSGFSNKKWILDLKSFFLIILMGLFFTGSLAMYSSGMNGLSITQQVIGWPALMVSIILASQLWGEILKETKYVNKKSKIFRVFSVLLLLSAIILLASEAS